jgi:hypothetical protein
LKLPWRRQGAPDPSIAAAIGASAASASRVSPSLLAWAEALDATRLSDDTVVSSERFLRDYRRMGNLRVRREIALGLRSAITAEVSPRPPVSASSMDVIATAISVRRRQLGLG